MYFVSTCEGKVNSCALRLGCRLGLLLGSLLCLIIDSVILRGGRSSNGLHNLSRGNFPTSHAGRYMEYISPLGTSKSRLEYSQLDGEGKTTEGGALLHLRSLPQRTARFRVHTVHLDLTRHNILYFIVVFFV